MHSWIRLSTALVVAGFPALALAHPGHAHAAAAPGFVAGLTHPLTGADHLAAALVLAAAIALAAPLSLRWPTLVALGALVMGSVHAGVHALVPPAGASFAAGVAVSTLALYAAAAAAGLFAAKRLRRGARTD